MNKFRALLFTTPNYTRSMSLGCGIKWYIYSDVSWCQEVTNNYHINFPVITLILFLSEFISIQLDVCSLFPEVFLFVLSWYFSCLPWYLFVCQFALPPQFLGGDLKAYLVIVQSKLMRNLGLFGILVFTIYPL